MSDLQKVVRWVHAGSHVSEVVVWCVVGLVGLYVVGIMFERVICGTD